MKTKGANAMTTATKTERRLDLEWNAAAKKGDQGTLARLRSAYEALELGYEGETPVLVDGLTPDQAFKLTDAYPEMNFVAVGRTWVVFENTGDVETLVDSDPCDPDAAEETALQACFKDLTLAQEDFLTRSARRGAENLKQKLSRAL